MERKTMKNQLSTIKEINSTNLSEADLHSLFSWPPKSYTCTFCKRDFRSAQALGGHMNVHRMDRARLRQAISNHHPHLNFNIGPNPSSLKVHKPLMKIPPPVSTISTTAPATFSGHLVKWGGDDFSQELMAARRFFELEKIRSMNMMHVNGINLPVEKDSGNGIVKMELEFGLMSKVKEDDDLDLELRLGFA